MDPPANLGRFTVCETRLATATRVVKFFRSIGDTVDPLNTIERIRLGARFAFDQATLRAYASSFQLYLIQAAAAIHAKGDDIPNWQKAVAVVRNDINDSCGELGALAGFPKGADRSCLKSELREGK